MRWIILHDRWRRRISGGDQFLNGLKIRTSSCLKSSFIPGRNKQTMHPCGSGDHGVLQQLRMLLGHNAAPFSEARYIHREDLISRGQRIVALSPRNATAISTAQPSLIALPGDLHKVAPFWRSKSTCSSFSIAGVSGDFTHPMKEDVKKKRFSPPLRKMRVW